MSWRKGVLLIAFFILLLPAVSLGANYIAVDVPELRNSIAILAHLDGDAEPALIVGQGHSVFALGVDGTKPLIEGVSGRISALAVGDMNGDFKNEILIATESGGALYFYVEKGGVWERQGQPQYLWDTISLLDIHDFNQDGWGDLLVITGRGEAQILLSMEGTLQPFWKSKLGEVVVGAEIIDVDNDGYPELIYALRSGYVGVLGWVEQDFAAQWENYPWGSVESLVVLTNQDTPEWLVVTSQKMLYGWRYRNDEVVSSRTIEGTELGERLFYIPGEGLLSLSQKSGIALFELKSTSVSEAWRVPGLSGDHAFYYQGYPYFRDRNGVYYRIVQGEAHWRVFLHNQEITESVALLTEGDELFLCLPDIAERLGLMTVPDNDWYYTQEDHELILEPGNKSVQYDDLIIPMKHPILQVEGVPYVAAEVFSFLGWQVDFDPSRQHVVIQRNWGWWL
ncbi:MAG: hypothetical protein GX979_01440 [Firmicutes bacterium]|nr:hypothetical protein [Bacillota bacterium]